LIDISLPVLQSLGQVVGFDYLGAVEVSYRACQFEGAVKCPCGETDLLHGRFEQGLGWGIDLAELPYFKGGHVRVIG